MRAKIYRLPEPVINQIAAGEVVENPASVVKELIENSLDAGAKRIAVEIVQGGSQLIRVEDDGCGMGPEDALLCLERHATSKIKTVDDLQELITMGFRGEALAAISAISHLELKSALEGGTGTRVVAEGGKVIKVEPCARNSGTTIEIRSLFFNVPARKKFQKSAAANTAQVVKMVEVLSMAHPEVAFSLTHQGKTALDVQMAPQKTRVEEIWGEHELSFAWKNGGVRIEGFAAEPGKAMPTRTRQQVFINRRPIFSPLIARAVKESFGTRIAEHAYPPFVLFLELPPDAVDINVHPQKREARFRDERAIFHWVVEAVNSAFSAPLSFSQPLTFRPSSPFSAQETFPPLPFVLHDEPQELGFIYTDRPVAVFGSFLLVQQKGLLLVDLRAAHARILFESLKVEKGKSQALIWPLEIDLQRGEEEIGDELGQLGIECRILPRKLIIDALPPYLEAAHFPLFLESWKEKKRLDQSALSFCRKVKKEYALEEAFLLWQRLQTCQDRLFDPLGNRIWAEIQEEHLEQVLKHA